jgi:hypothetical protein
MMNFQNYLQRNKDIVNNCNYLIACPYSNKEQLSSGVWSTIRYAKKLIIENKNISLLIFIIIIQKLLNVYH